jgi:glycosyltransferase involved in cell wall biosynthesis
VRNDYDVMIVGYPGQIIAVFAKFLSKRKVVLDALCSLYEAEVISRNSTRIFYLRGVKIWLIDFFAYFFADMVLVETEAQKQFFIKKFFVNPKKIAVVYTGADDSIFFPDSSVKKRNRFTAVFRGRFLPEAGVDVIIKSAKILENDDIDILIIGSGLLDEKIKALISSIKPKNLLVEPKHLSFDEIRRLMLSCHVSLGQFANHERLDRTIPHKAFESLALGLPYITARAKGISEILRDGENCFMTNPADPKDLSEKIIQIKNELSAAQKIGNNELDLYKSNFTPYILAKKIIFLLENLI